MSESEAIALIQAHATEWGVPRLWVLRSEPTYTWWYFGGPEWYSFTLDSGAGIVNASVHVESRTVHRFDYAPIDPAESYLPLWAAFPTFTSVTSGWRQSYGEEYMRKWYAFYRALPQEAKADYRRRYPPPNDNERGWEHFYEVIAEVRATDEHPIADFILGRRP